MRFPSKCIVLAACWAAALATPAKIGDGNLGAANAGPGEQDSSGRDSKLLFSFVTISPEACRTTGGQSGVCYSTADCTTLNGTADGNCASGLGVCCRITRTCGTASAFRETTFTNENYPSTRAVNAGNCRLRITPLNNNICQLRLDLDDFTLAQPDNEGVCTQDFMTVIAGSSNIPTICGDNTGQHMYVDVSPQFGSAVINIDTAAAGAKWSIKVTQIECNAANRAPSGCLQFFNSTTGTFRSFNYNSNGGAVTRQLANQMYGVCIQSQPGYCSVTYSPQSATGPFSVSGDATPGAVNPTIIVPPDLGAAACPTDYLIIPGGMITNSATFTTPPTSVTADRFCGISFPNVLTNVQPFNVFFVADDREALNLAAGANPDLSNQGFHISYRMNAC